jgi:hypothetical protein
MAAVPSSARSRIVAVIVEAGAIDCAAPLFDAFSHVGLTKATSRLDEARGRMS